MPQASTTPSTLPNAREATVGSLLTWGRRRLTQAEPPVAGREAALLLKSALDLDEAVLRAHPERPVNEEQAQAFADRLRRRLAGEPAAYLIGRREFYGRQFHVDERVLIPRPETELLIELALESSPSSTILDLGTGSGCLAITLAAERPRTRVTAVDISPAALACAAVNARLHGVEDRVRLVCGDWTEALDLRDFDLVVANPPYLSDAEWEGCGPEIRQHEPRGALVAAERGLAAYRLLAEALAELKPGCRVLFEIGAHQARQVAALCGPILEEVSVQIHRDLSGLDRVVVGTRRSASEAAQR